MKLKELFETEFIFECVLNEVKYTFYKKYSNSDQKRILINFVCQMFEEHSIKDKGIEYEIRSSPNILSLNQLKSIFKELNKLSNEDLGKIFIKVDKNITEKSTGSVFVLTINEKDTLKLLNIETNYGIYIKFLIAKLSAPQNKNANGIIIYGTRDGYEVSNNLILDSENLRICFLSSKHADKNMKS